MDTQAIIAIFNDTENKVEEVAQAFRDFVALIPRPEGVYDIRLEPKQVDSESGCLDYAAHIVWDNDDSLGTTELFRVEVDLETGYPLWVTCLSCKQINSDEELGEFFERVLADEVKAMLRGQIALRKAGKLTLKYLCHKPGTPEPPALMIKV